MFSAKTGLMALVFLLVVFGLAAAGRHESGGGTVRGESPAVGADPAAVRVQGQQIDPVPMPDPGIPGYRFPESEQAILKWVATDNLPAISKHAWGLWTALTSDSGEEFEDQKLLVFETWLTPGEIPVGGAAVEGRPRRRNPRPLGVFHQFRKRTPLRTFMEGEETVTGFVKYDPPAAEFTAEQELFSKARLNEWLEAGVPAIPDFPSDAVTLKPVFQTIPQGKLIDDRYYLLKAWTGPPAEPRPYGSKAWPGCVWVDIEALGSEPGSGDVDTTCSPDGSSRTDATTYGVGQFVHFQLSADQAEELNALHESLGAEIAPAAEGDYAILLAMHVTSREISRWTWQTFWWAQNPDQPYAPSSEAIASARPDQLEGAPRNYAHCNSYSMVFPPQPNTGGSNTGNSVYCYNPWLEAGFGPSDLPASRPGKHDGKPVKNNVGVETNCMSCHAQASYSPEGALDGKLYTGDRYIDLDGPQFKGNLRVDFLWSIPANAK